MTREFIVNEKESKTPYLVMWVSVNSLISIEKHSTLDDARRHEKKLKELGREPSILLALSNITKECLACGHSLPLTYFIDDPDLCYLCDIDESNPYLLTGDELDKAEKSAKRRT